MPNDVATCGAKLSTGQGSAEVCVLPPHARGTWHRGSTWPHGMAMEWIEAQTRQVEVADVD